MCKLELPSRARRALTVPWRLKVERLLSPGCHWTAARMISERLEGWALLRYISHFDAMPKKDASLSYLVSRLSAADGALSADTWRALIDGHDFLTSVIDRHVSAANHVERLREVFDLVSDLTDDDSDEEHDDE